MPSPRSLEPLHELALTPMVAGASWCMFFRSNRCGSLLHFPGLTGFNAASFLGPMFYNSMFKVTQISKSCSAHVQHRAVEDAEGSASISSHHCRTAAPW